MQTRNSLEALDRRQLQCLARQAGIEADVNSSLIIDQLLSRQADDVIKNSYTPSIRKQLKAEPILGREIFPILRMLYDEDNNLRLTRERCIPIVEAMEGRISVDGRGDNRDGATLWDVTASKLFAYLRLEHFDLFERIDPFFVVVDGRNGFPQGYLDWIAAYLRQRDAKAIQRPGLVAVNNSKYVFAFEAGTLGIDNSSNFIGALQDHFPGLYVWRFEAPAMAYY